MKKIFKLLSMLFTMTVLLTACGGSDTIYPIILPTITAVTPSIGPTGTTVVITGTHFSSDPALNIVMFNGTAAVVTSATSTELVTTVPVGATTGPITVKVGLYTATSPADFVVTPAITAVTPSTGPTGTAVTITGTSFSIIPADNIVMFNGTAAVVTSSTATSIATTVPVGATTGPITVKVGLITATSPADFTVTASTFLLGGAIQGNDLLLSPLTALVSTPVIGLSSPSSITTDGTNFYVANFGTNTILMIDSLGAVTTLAGSGTAAEADGDGTAASFNGPSGITTDGTNLYVTDFTGHTIRQIGIASPNTVTTLAGSATAGAADGDRDSRDLRRPYRHNDGCHEPLCDGSYSKHDPPNRNCLTQTP